MLRQRIITAVLMLLVLIPALFHADIRYLAYIGFFLIGASAWEWGRLNGSSQVASLLLGIVTMFICLFIFIFNMINELNQFFWFLIGGSWVLSGFILLRGGQSRWKKTNVFVRLMIGPVMLVSAWIALYQCKLIGTGFLLSILLLVWVADISAYFVGRKWGLHKLAPDISPGKSWEGLVGGVCGVFLLSVVWLELDLFFPMLQDGIFEKLKLHGWLIFSISILFLTLMGVVGDLIESLIKRSSGVKDSSQLLPGHGGVLDRLDALLPVLPLAVMLIQYPYL